MFLTKSFLQNISNKIIPNIVEMIYKLRTELEVKINKSETEIDKLKEQVKMLAKKFDE